MDDARQGQEQDRCRRYRFLLLLRFAVLFRPEHLIDTLDRQEHHKHAQKLLQDAFLSREQTLDEDTGRNPRRHPGHDFPQLFPVHIFRVPDEHIKTGQQSQHRLCHRIPHQQQAGGHRQDRSGKTGNPLDDVGPQNDQQKQDVVHHHASPPTPPQAFCLVYARPCFLPISANSSAYLESFL